MDNNLQSFLFSPVKDLWKNKAFQREACRYVSSCAGGGGSQVNSDWDATTGVAEILNKPDLTIYEEKSNKGAVNGYASLVGGVVPNDQLPYTLLDYKGSWVVNSSPVLANGVGDVGDIYIVSSGGTALGETWVVGNMAIYNGSVWEKIGAVVTATVTSVSPADISRATVVNGTTAAVIDVVSAPKLTTARTINGISFDGQANISVPIAESAVTFTDITTNNASSTKHGYLPKLDNTGSKYLRDDGTWQSVAGGTPSIDNLTAATLVTITDADNFVFNGINGVIQTITLGASRTFTISNLKIGIPYTFIVKQDGTGSKVLTWGTTTLVAYAGAGTPVISTGANAIDIYKLVSDGTNIYCDYALNYS